MIINTSSLITGQIETIEDHFGNFYFSEASNRTFASRGDKERWGSTRGKGGREAQRRGKVGGGDDDLLHTFSQPAAGGTYVSRLGTEQVDLRH